MPCLLLFSLFFFPCRHSVYRDSGHDPIFYCCWVDQITGSSRKLIGDCESSIRLSRIRAWSGRFVQTIFQVLSNPAISWPRWRSFREPGTDRLVCRLTGICGSDRPESGGLFAEGVWRWLEPRRREAVNIKRMKLAVQ